MKQLKEACEVVNGLQMEYTAPYTPLQNGVVEHGFVTVRVMAHAMMIDTRLK